MLDFYISGILAGVIILFIKFDGIAICANSIVPRYKKFRELNKLVASQYPDSKTGGRKARYISYCLIFTASMAILGKLLYRNAVQWATDNVKQIDKNTYEFTYVLDGKLYKMVTSLVRGPRKVLQISDHNQEDVTDVVHAYIGPRGNWHGHVFTPTFFKKQSLTFELADGQELTFGDDDQIDLNRVPIVSEVEK